MVSEAEVISVHCTCGKKLKARSTSIGKKARCPACRAIVVISDGSLATTIPKAATLSAKVAPPPLPAKKPGRSAVSAPTDYDGLGALYELANQANSATPIADVPQCPGCCSAMAKDAVLCTNCGYDTRTGKSLASASAKAAKVSVGNKSKKPVDYLAPQGSFLAGLGLSAVFAIGASSLWIGFAYLTGFTLSYIAILIGIAAGAGMNIGQRGFSKAGGSVASAMTLAAILLAKLAVLQLALNRQGMGRTLYDLNSAKVSFYFFSPIGVIIMLVGMGAAFRTANGSVRD